MRKNHLLAALISVGMMAMMCIYAPEAKAEYMATLDTNIIIDTPAAGGTLISGSSYDITWHADGTIKSVNIFYSSDGGTNWISQDILNNNPGTYTWTVPSTATTQGIIQIDVERLITFPILTYKHYYNNSGIFTIKKLPQPVMPGPILIKPCAPADLAVTGTTSDTADLTWTDKSFNESGFFVHRKLDGAVGYTSIGSVDPNITSFHDTGLVPGTKYHYVVTAYNSIGSSSFSNNVTATTPAIPTLVKPDPPSNLSASAVSSSQIYLSWQDNSDNESGFKLERSLTQTDGYTQIANLLPGSTSYDDNGLSAATTYFYRVKAFNSAGDSAYSPLASATTHSAAVEEQPPENTAPPESTTTVLRFYIDKPQYFINDTASPMDTAPVIKDNRTLLPIRYVATPLGAEVAWEPDSRKVTISHDGTRIEMWIGKNTALVNGSEKLIDPNNSQVTPIILPPGRTMLPLRFISENLGCQVDWNNTLREAKVTYTK